MDITFEWDEEKYLQNLTKHRIRFEDAIQIWTDELAIEFFDEDHSELEERYIRIGRHPLKNILIVVFCERGDSIIRIISARMATKSEITFYER